jgi:hypothetical protein
MKGIMFNEHYGLESETLNGTKTRTSRIVNIPKTRCGKEVVYLQPDRDNIFTKVEVDLLDADGFSIEPDPSIIPSYKLNEVVAIKQSYSIALSLIDWCHREIYKDEAGWTNKMFVRNDLMPHHIKITDINVQYLQDISDEDILKEGIYYAVDPNLGEGWTFKGSKMVYDIPIDAFKELIDKTCGKGTWCRDPLVWVYYYKLVD